MRKKKMTLRDNLIKITNEAIANYKKQKETKENERTKEGRKRAKEWANNIIKNLPKKMEDEAQKEKDGIVVNFDRRNEEGRWGMEYLKEWVELQGFIANVNGTGDGLIIKWIWKKNSGPSYYYE